MNTDRIETRLNSFDPKERRAALMDAVTAIDKGILLCDTLSHPTLNMHCHSFFSYNGYGYTPSYLAYLAKRRNFQAVGLVDFDVLDGMDEFLFAAGKLKVKAVVGMETRVFIPELADVEINSPGEPGIAYHLGCGFSRVPESEKAFLAGLRKRANDRTRKLVGLVNDYLKPLTIDFEATAKKFTPGGNVTERHVCEAYRIAAEAMYPDAAERAAFWGKKLSATDADASKWMSDPVKLEGAIRSKTMKKGGVGYIAPTPESFPCIDEMNNFIIACGAVPTVAWLNGLSAGESDPAKLLELHQDKGAGAVTLIPDRNWRASDPVKQKQLTDALDRFVIECIRRDLPILAGTEMNAPGQLIADDFSVPALAKHYRVFLAGANELAR
ncbi:MAG: PHP domain-containing protein [Victivallaceae bacterium]|nr:PHP domain-containing protein [Victivallaceae bacterium]